ncbi:MAG: alpha/beta hydrolase [Bdellovibrionaceae bacterium]|nr:alpha/beta hydrolase [Bdellovibrionales bacterium]MCB9084698.1 alpha/beta hydrolase [Pseudobdellovibrionaceae bacterium]
MDSDLIEFFSQYGYWSLALILGVLLVALGLWVWRRRLPPARPWSPDVQFANIDGFKIRYIIEGRGPNLLLIHGIAAHIYAWRKLIPLLAPHYRLIAIDLPGFGYSSKNPKADYGLDAQCERIEKLLDALGIEQTRILGSSMGGSLALHLARRNPRRFWEVVCISPATSRKLMPVKAHRLSWASSGLQYLVTPTFVSSIYKTVVHRQDQIDRQVIDEYHRPYHRNPDSIKTFLSASQFLLDSRIEDNPGKVEIPVLYLWGKWDRIVPLKYLRRLEHKFGSKIRSAIHPNAGHHVMEDDPEWVCKMCLGFFGHHDF